MRTHKHKRHRTKFGCLGDLAPGICASKSINQYINHSIELPKTDINVSEKPAAFFFYSENGNLIATAIKPRTSQNVTCTKEVIDRNVILTNQGDHPAL
jgi:hypothetical protein